MAPRTAGAWAYLGFFETIHDGGKTKQWLKLEADVVKDFDGTGSKQEGDLALKALVDWKDYRKLKNVVKGLREQGYKLVRVANIKGVLHFYARPQKEGQLLNLQKLVVVC